MKKLLAIAVALIICALPVLATAEGNVILDALMNNHKITTEVSIALDGEEFESVNNSKFINEVQLDPFFLRFATEKGEETVTDFSVGSDFAGQSWYLKSALLGKTLGFHAGDLALLGTQLLDGLVADGIIDQEDLDALAETYEEAQAAEAEEHEEVEQLFEDLDLTHLYRALFSLSKCVSITDCEDYNFTDMSDFLSSAYKLRDDAYISDEMLAPYTETIGASASDEVKMLLNISVTPEDVRTLLEALMATAEANPQLGAAFGIAVEDLAEAQEAFLETISEDMWMVIGLNEDSKPVFVTGIISVQSEEGMTTVTVDGINTSDENGNSFVGLKLAATDPYTIGEEAEEEEGVEAGETVAFREIMTLADVHQNDNNLFWLILGDSEQPGHFNIIADDQLVSLSEEEEVRHGDLIFALEDGDNTSVLKFVEDSKLVTDNGDFTLDDTLSYVDNETGKALGSVIISMHSSDTVTIDSEDAVYPAHMSEEEQDALLDDMLENVSERIEDVLDPEAETEAPVEEAEAVEEAVEADAE